MVLHGVMAYPAVFVCVLPYLFLLSKFTNGAITVVTTDPSGLPVTSTESLSNMTITSRSTELYVSIYDSLKNVTGNSASDENANNDITVIQSNSNTEGFTTHTESSIEVVVSSKSEEPTIEDISSTKDDTDFIASPDTDFTASPADSTDGKTALSSDGSTGSVDGGTIDSTTRSASTTDVEISNSDDSYSDTTDSTADSDDDSTGTIYREIVSSTSTAFTTTAVEITNSDDSYSDNTVSTAYSDDDSTGTTDKEIDSSTSTAFTTTDEETVNSDDDSTGTTDKEIDSSTSTAFTTTDEETVNSTPSISTTTTDVETTDSTSIIVSTTEVNTGSTETITQTTVDINTTWITEETSAVLQQTTTSAPGPKRDVSVAVVASILGILLLAGLLVMGFVMFRQGKLPWTGQNSNVMVTPQPIPLRKFKNHCNQLLETSERLGNEFKLLKMLSEDIANSNSVTAATLPRNRLKNRYINILPYDMTRVKLEVTDDNPSDYINASYIMGYSKQVEYIACQGPTENSLEDFWRMIIQEKIHLIVMVTGFEEGGKKKCEPYFPKLRDVMIIGENIIRCTTELPFITYTQRTLDVHLEKSKITVTHLHFNEWPDFGCPEGTFGMLHFCGTIRDHLSHNPGLVLVHCSAGVGRTGTLITTDILLQHIQRNKTVDIFGTVYSLRKQRTNMVQTEGQYAYIYKCIRDALDNTSILNQNSSPSHSMEPLYENVSKRGSSLCLYEKISEVKPKLSTGSSENECEL